MHKRGEGTHPLDVRIGNRIRARRKQLKLSQHGLAARLGISFQQVQKYEQARNSLRAAGLAEIAAALDVDVSYFFEVLDEARAPARYTPRRVMQEAVEQLLAQPEGWALVEAMLALHDVQQRKNLVLIAQGLAAAAAASCARASSGTEAPPPV